MHHLTASEIDEDRLPDVTVISTPIRAAGSAPASEFFGARYRVSNAQRKDVRR